MFFEQFERLCRENGTNPTSFTINILHLSSSKVTAWKNGSIPKYEILNSIAGYFGVTIGYLFDGEQKITPSELSENEQKMLGLFRKLSDVQQERIIERAMTLAESNEPD